VTVLAQRTAIRKDADSGLDVDAWNSQNPLHPRSGDGRFSRVAGVLSKLADEFGEIIRHEEIGEADHDIHSHGVLTLHDDGRIVMSSIDEDGTHYPFMQVFGSFEWTSLAESISNAGTEANAAELHDPIKSYDFHDEYGGNLDISFGTESPSGDPFVGIDTDEGGLSLSPEHAWALSEAIGEIGDARDLHMNDDPELARPLRPGETLMRAQKIGNSDSERDVFIGLVEGPEGRRVRMSFGGSDDLPFKNFTGGLSQVTADMGPHEAAEFEEALGHVEQSRAEYEARLAKVRKMQADWVASDDPAAVEYRALQEKERAYYRDRYSNPYLTEAERNRMYDLYPQHLQDAIDDEDVGQDGEEVDGTEIATAHGTIEIELVGHGMSWDEKAQGIFTVRVRPPGYVSHEEWAGDANYDIPEAELTKANVKKLRELLRTAFLDAEGNPVTKSAGSATDAPGAGRARALKRYWTRGKGLAKWVRSAHPWTTLHRHLGEYIHDPDKLDRTTSAWFHAATGMWSGERKGKNPLGRG
jgi:hypothetical protein